MEGLHQYAVDFYQVYLRHVLFQSVTHLVTPGKLPNFFIPQCPISKGKKHYSAFGKLLVCFWFCCH